MAMNWNVEDSRGAQRLWSTPGGDFLDYLLKYNVGNHMTKELLCRPLFDNKVFHNDCLVPMKTLFDSNLLLPATRKSAQISGVANLEHITNGQLIYAYAWWLWTSPYGIFKMINASNSMRIERLADVFHLPQMKSSIDSITSEDYNMRQPGNNTLWRGEISRGNYWLDNILNHPLWPENRCDNQFHTFMIHQKHFTSFTDNVEVAKMFAEIRPSVDGNDRRALFQITGKVRITDDGNIEYIDNIVETNNQGYQDISFYVGEREYLLKPGIFFIRCPNENNVENIPRSATESEHKIFRVYHFPGDEIYNLSLAIMFEFIDGYARVANLREGESTQFKGRIRTYFEQNRGGLEEEFKIFIDPSNNQMPGGMREWSESIINRRDFTQSRIRFEQEYILPIFGEIVENVDYSGYYSLAFILLAAGISSIM
jgi:hypothetical protein